ncbi:transcriptional regulator GlxA family with amidase domain [Lipingzhangella halophila]|uniref:Transcriptional regulator GlxA family with amidase domain n=1 Tax=Lipingzhangella halophila TaxID=1783352 RepID=A0A7W7W4S0_9ACTN|nr:DJ-1/PfpI family protein [Lipingzhangella halophila]MBB4934467.1 transcriptional regulator GlxA family with amidase domain [Lipingzhangella halophila]
MDIAFAMYPGMTVLDLTGPHEILAHHPEAAVHYLAATPGPVRCDSGMEVTATGTFGDVPSPDVIVVPGSSQWRRALEEQRELVAWLALAHPSASWTTSVCTGSTLLAKAGILSGRTATTHWGVRDVLGGLGAEVSTERVVVDGDVITAAGVSAGIDMGLVLAARLWGENTARAIQLFVEYAPEPPFDSGNPETAPPEMLDQVARLLPRSEGSVPSTGP